MKEHKFVTGDLVTFSDVNVDDIYAARLGDLGVVIGTDSGIGLDTTIYKVYWYKSRKIKLSLACHLKLVYTIEEE